MNRTNTTYPPRPGWQHITSGFERDSATGQARSAPLFKLGQCAQAYYTAPPTPNFCRSHLLQHSSLNPSLNSQPKNRAFHLLFYHPLLPKQSPKHEFCKAPKPPHHCVMPIPSDLTRSQYGNVNTPSYIQCNGINEDKPDNFEVTLTTNTAITNCLEAGKCYVVMGKLITTQDGSPPVITYNQSLPAVITMPNGTELDMINRVGHVVSATKVSCGNSNNTTCLEVIVAHNDWDSRVKYIIPGTKNLRGTFKIYAPGQEVQITSHLVDYDMDLLVAVAVVDFVAVTNGHGTLREAPPTSSLAGSPSKAGWNFIKFKPCKVKASPGLLSNVTGKTLPLAYMKTSSKPASP
ncbi:hypothetical protein PCANC_28426 [Puccinia coronata f. sp. avenae]|uniref:Uncharacterized protein n=1 Tax=Puccinia coronata f. sp. avenae TaxID=200324 RepID=A0A2N5RWG6_9BASI|nr:hypothetical protein PCANC_28426 [Puccinia coronata f. sp. avenae]